MREALVALVVLLAAAVYCDAYQLAQKDELQIEILEVDQEILRQEIAKAEEKEVSLAGGQVKALVGARLETLRLTEALLAQRIQSVRSGAPLKLEVPGTQPDPELAASLEKEIALQTTSLEGAQREAARYAGRLTGALAQSTVATQEQTLAMLNQRYLSAKYGLASPKLEGRGSGTSGDAASSDHIQDTPPTRDRGQSASKRFEIIDVDTRVTESNDSWSKFAWKLTLRNLTDQPATFDAVVEFQDSDGFVVDDAREYRLVLGPNQENTFTGYTLIVAAVARNVSRISAKVQAD